LDLLRDCHADSLVAHSLALDAGSSAAFAARRAAGALSFAEDRAVGALLGMAFGDALGAPFEFLPQRVDGCRPA
jgi:hypothetical protein